MNVEQAYEEYVKNESARWATQVAFWNENLIGSANIEASRVSLELAGEYFLMEHAPDAGYDTYMLRALQEINSYKDFIKLQFLIHVLTRQPANWDQIQVGFNHVFDLFVTLHQREDLPNYASPFWFLIEQMVDYIEDNSDDSALGTLQKLIPLDCGGNQYHNIISVVLKAVQVISYFNSAHAHELMHAAAESPIALVSEEAREHLESM